MSKINVSPENTFELLHLQDVHSENDVLKARIAELELQHAKAARCDLLEREVEKLRVSLAIVID